MILPVVNHLVTSDYGHRELNGIQQFHDGIDFISKTGNEVLAITGGVVVFDKDNYNEAKRWVSIDDSAGNYLIINHYIEEKQKNYYCRYLHLGENKVTMGDVVIEGQFIGTYADAGISYGAHLHFDCYDNNWKKIDPHFLIGHLITNYIKGIN